MKCCDHLEVGMNEQTRPMLMLLLCGLAVAFSATRLLSQEFRITGATISPDGRLHLEHGADADSYYVLYRGSNLRNIVLPIDLAIGQGPQGRFEDLAITTSIGAAFYRVQKISLSHPLDTDGDGIDDVWELTHRRPGSALNKLDANEDHDGNGVPDLLDWQRERLPSISFIQRTSSAREGQGTLAVEIRLNNAYSGFVQFGVTGTAMAGTDYRPVTGNLVVNGTNALVTLSLLDDLEIEDTKTILLTLRTSDAVPAKYSLGTAFSHVVLLEDNDHRWQGQFVRDGLRLPFELTVAQRGTNIQAALVSDGSGGVPSGTWPVSMRVGGGTFAADIGPIVLPENNSLVNVGMVRLIHLEAAVPINAFEVATLGPTIEGIMREEIVIPNPSYQHLSRIGNRAILGTFTLQMVPSNLPRNDPALSVLTP
jgi:Calx-beta domain